MPVVQEREHLDLQSLGKPGGWSCACGASQPRVPGGILPGVAVLGQAQALGHFLLLMWPSLGFYSSSPS